MGFPHSTFHENNFQKLFPNIENCLKCYKVVKGAGGKCHWQYSPNPFLFPSSVILFPKDQRQAARSPCVTFALRWGALTCARHAQGPSALAASLCVGTTAGCRGVRALMTVLPASRPPGLPTSRAPGLHAHALLLPASPRFGLVLVFPSFTFPTPRISGSLQHPFPALSLPKHPYRQHLGFCVRFRMTLGKEGGTSSGTCSRVTIVPGSWHENVALTTRPFAGHDTWLRNSKEDCHYIRGLGRNYLGQHFHYSRR